MLLQRIIYRYAALTLSSVALATPSLAQDVVQRAVPEAAIIPVPVLPSRAATPFIDTGWVFLKDTRPGVFNRDNVWQVTTGMDFSVLPTVSLSLGLTYTDVDRTTRIPVGTYSSSGLTGFVGTTIQVLDNWAVQLSAGYGVADVDQIRLIRNSFVSSDLTTTSRFISATTYGTYFAGDLLIRPIAQILYAASRDTSFAEAPDVVTPGALDTIGRASVGTELSYPFIVGDVLVAPVIRAAFIYDVNLPRDYTDRTAFELTAGLDFVSGDVSGGIRAASTVGRDDYLNYGARAFLSYRF